MSESKVKGRAGAQGNSGNKTQPPGNFQGSSLGPDSPLLVRGPSSPGDWKGGSGTLTHRQNRASFGDSGRSWGRRPCGKAPATHSSNGGKHTCLQAAQPHADAGHNLWASGILSLFSLCIPGIPGHQQASMGIPGHPRASRGIHGHPWASQAPTGMGEGAAGPGRPRMSTDLVTVGPWTQGCGFSSWQKTCPHMQTPREDLEPSDLAAVDSEGLA